MNFTKSIFLLFLLTLNFTLAFAQWNFDESQVKPYILPDAFTLANGKKNTTENEWWKLRRPEIFSFFENEVYGKTPTKRLGVSYKISSIDKNALEGRATRKEIRVTFRNGKKSLAMDILMYIPNAAIKAVPLFLGMNFDGNQCVIKDTTISITDSWVDNDKRFGITDNRANEKTRGSQKRRWPIEKIIERGYAVATIYYGDLDPDFDDGFQNGIQPLFYKNGQTKPAPNEWGAIGAWAWGLSRALDYFETDKQIDAKKVLVHGHSRLGKAALWAGAQDERFAMVISNNSGCMGAALSKRNFGEDIKTINKAFPHWFCANFKKYNDNEASIPFDQHELIALIAPRPVYVTSAQDDLWADPKGEFLSTFFAGEVYELLREKGLPVTEQPPIHQPVMGTIGYHIRAGKHDVTDYDWEQYMNFADTCFYKKIKF